LNFPELSTTNYPTLTRRGGIQMYRRAPLYVDRVLKGSKPADLPVELPIKVEFLINLHAAKKLGVEVPLSLLIRADELLE
jgi:putative ABC transport system substrate-binding protein